MKNIVFRNVHLVTLRLKTHKIGFANFAILLNFKFQTVENLNVCVRSKIMWIKSVNNASLATIDV